MTPTVDDLDDAAEDRISPNDCDLSGAYTTEYFVWEIATMLARV